MNNDSSIATYYSEELRENVLELTDRRVMWDITDNMLYEASVRHEINEFEKKYGTPLFCCGRSGRHICVKDTQENRNRYGEMRDYVKSRIDSLVKENNEYKGKPEENPNPPGTDKMRKVLLECGVAPEKLNEVISKLITAYG